MCILIMQCHQKSFSHSRTLVYDKSVSQTFDNVGLACLCTHLLFVPKMLRSMPNSTKAQRSQDPALKSKMSA